MLQMQVPVDPRVPDPWSPGPLFIPTPVPVHTHSTVICADHFTHAYNIFFCTANCGVLQILSACAHGSGKQSIGEVLLTFLVLYAITQLFWIVKVSSGHQ